MIRKASFKRSRFNLAELHQWQRRTGVQTIFSVRYSDTKAHVTYKGVK